MSMRFCGECGHVFAQESDCAVCTEPAYLIDDKPYSFDEICSQVTNGVFSGFTLVQNDRTYTPLHCHRDFLSYFLRDWKGGKKNLPQQKSPINEKSSRKRSNKPIHYDNKKKSRNVQKALLFLLLVVLIVFFSYENPNFLDDATPYPPTKFEQFINKERRGGKGTIGFPKEGDVDILTKPLRDSYLQWNGSDVGAFLLAASLKEGVLPKEFGYWLSWSSQSYPKEQSIKAAEASWSLRYALLDDGCSSVQDCDHLACLAIASACRNEKNLSNPYYSRFALMVQIAGKKYPESEDIESIPKPLQFALQGDIAVQKRDYSTALQLYSKAKASKLDVDDQLILVYAMMNKFSKIASLVENSQRNIKERSTSSKYIIIRAYIELGAIEKAYDLWTSLPSTAVQKMQKHHLHALMKKEDHSDFDCAPQNHIERLYCARIYIMKGKYDRAVNMVSPYPLGDPNRSVVELLIAMRKGDSILMEDSIESFAYGQPKLLAQTNPHSAFVPSLDTEEIVRALSSVLKNKETKHIVRWALSSSSQILKADVVSAPVCSAVLQLSLENKSFEIAEEKLRCLGFFDIDEQSIQFYRNYLKAKQSPDIYADSTWMDMLGEESPRSLLYWKWMQNRSSKVQNQMIDEDRLYLGFGRAWFRAQMDSLE